MVSVDRPGLLQAFGAVLALQLVVTLTVLPPLAAVGLPGWVQVVVVALLSVALRVWLGTAIARRALRRGAGSFLVPSVALGAVVAYLLTVMAGWALVEVPGSIGGWFAELARVLVGVAVTTAPLAAAAWWHVRSDAGERGRGSQVPLR